MKKFSILIILISLLPLKLLAIVGGSPTALNNHPWQIRVGANCGGSLISSNIILTAAHCLMNNPKHIYGLGSGNSNGLLKIAGIKNSIIHPEYDDSSLINDIAILELDTHVKFDKRLSSIQLARPIDLPDVGTKVKTSGWGWSKRSATGFGYFGLLEADLKIVEHLRDSQQYTPADLNNLANKLEMSNLSNFVKGSIILTFGDYKQATCNGDSGGPLSTLNSNGDRILIGTTSFGVDMIDSATGCDGLSGFTSIPFYYHWIIEEVERIELYSGFARETLE
jgi:secreted trypsin-like serine protease